MDSVPVVAYLITEFGYDPKTPNNYGNRPLHKACLTGQLHVAKYLITEQQEGLNMWKICRSHDVYHVISLSLL